MWPHRYRGYGVAVVKEGFLPWTINKQKWVFYLTDSVLEFIVGYFKITIDNYTMKITRFFSWSEKEKEIAKEMINLGCLLFTQTIQLDILCINMNKFIKIIIVLLRIPTGRRQFAIYKCCEQIQIGFRAGPESPVPERPVSTNLGLFFSTFFYLPSYALLRATLCVTHYCVSE